MRKYIVLLIIITFIFNLSGCSLQNVISKKKSGDELFEFEHMKPFSLEQCFWYEDNKVLLVFQEPGRIPEYMKLIILDINQKTSKTIYEDDFSVDLLNSLDFNNKTISYQNGKKTLVFNSKKMNLINLIKKPENASFARYSPNLKYAAGVFDGNLYISENNFEDKRLIEEDSDLYLSLNWSKDSSKLVYITNDYVDIKVIDIKSQEKKTIEGGKDFELPKKLVELRRSGFIPNSSDILVNMPCASNDVLAILDSNKGYEAKVISSEKRSTILDVSSKYIIYKQKKDNGSKLISYNIKNGAKNTIYDSDASITCASLSPNNNKIIFSTKLTGKQKLHFRDV